MQHLAAMQEEIRILKCIQNLNTFLKFEFQIMQSQHWKTTDAQFYPFLGCDGCLAINSQSIVGYGATLGSHARGD